MARGIKFVTVEHGPTCTDKKLSKSLKTVMKLYSRSSGLVKTVLIEMESDKTIDELIENVIVNTSAAKEQFSEIKRTICTVK